MFFSSYFISLLASVLHVSSSTCPPSSVQGLNPADCYRYFSGPSTWFGAEERCIAEGGHLASVPSGFVNSMLSGGQIYVETQFWIGGSIGIESPNAWTWTDNSPFKYAHFVPGSLKNSTSTSCTSLDLWYSVWYPVPCYQYRPFICKVPSLADPTCPSFAPPKITCASGWTYYGESKKCYMLLHGLKYYDALVECEKYNATLASIHSAEENIFLAELAQRYVIGSDHYESAWIGLHDPKHNAQWTWTDGSPLDYAVWAPKQPDGSGFCGQMFTDVDSSWGTSYGYPPFSWYRKWDDCGCEAVPSAAICQNRSQFLSCVEI